MRYHSVRRIIINLLLALFLTLLIAWVAAITIDLNIQRDKSDKFLVANTIYFDSVNQRNWIITDAYAAKLLTVEACSYSEKMQVYTPYVSEMPRKLKLESNKSIVNNDKLPYWSLISNNNKLSKGNIHVWQEEVYGWPFPCMQLLWLWDNDKRVKNIYYGIQINKEIQRPILYLTRPKAIPLKPIYFGFLLNTIFWCLVINIILSIKSKILSGYRLSKSKCPNCGYIIYNDILSGCPECGWNRK